MTARKKSTKPAKRNAAPVSSAVDAARHLAVDPGALLDAQRRVRRGEVKRQQAAAVHEAHPPVPATVMPAGPAPDAEASAAVLAERQYHMEMDAIATFATKRGLTFDKAKALESRLSTVAARRQVQEARAAADEALVTLCTPTAASQRESSDREQWGRAVAKAAERAGLKMGQGQ